MTVKIGDAENKEKHLFIKFYLEYPLSLGSETRHIKC